MGYMRNHMIAVSCGDYNGEFREALKKAKELFGYEPPHSPTVTNGIRTLFIYPDGSKEGWETSNEGDEKRDEFKYWLKTYRTPGEFGYNPFDWVEVQYGDDNQETLITDHSDLYPTE